MKTSDTKTVPPTDPQNPAETDGAAGQQSPTRAASPADKALARPTASDLSTRRRQTISDYLDEKLRSSPEVGLIGGVNADLACLALTVSEALSGFLADRHGTSDYLEDPPRGTEVLMKLARQIERNTRLMNEMAGR